LKVWLLPDPDATSAGLLPGGKKMVLVIYVARATLWFCRVLFFPSTTVLAYY